MITVAGRNYQVDEEYLPFLSCFQFQYDDRIGYPVTAHCFTLPRLVWFYHQHGKITMQTIQHKDGDKQNCRSDNLLVLEEDHKEIIVPGLKRAVLVSEQYYEQLRQLQWEVTSWHSNPEAKTNIICSGTGREMYAVIAELVMGAKCNESPIFGINLAPSSNISNRQNSSIQLSERYHDTWMKGNNGKSVRTPPIPIYGFSYNCLGDLCATVREGIEQVAVLLRYYVLRYMFNNGLGLEYRYDVQYADGNKYNNLASNLRVTEFAPVANQHLINLVVVLHNQCGITCQYLSVIAPATGVVTESCDTYGESHHLAGIIDKALIIIANKDMYPREYSEKIESSIRRCVLFRIISQVYSDCEVHEKILAMLMADIMPLSLCAIISDYALDSGLIGKIA